LQQSGSDGDLKYNSLQVTLRKQLSHGRQLQAAYTWARVFTNLQANLDQFGNQGKIDSNNPNDSRQQYGISNGYRSQRLVMNYTWDIPFKNKGIMSKLLGGWALSGVTTVQSGQPQTIRRYAGRNDLLRWLSCSILQCRFAGADGPWNDLRKRCHPRRFGSAARRR